MLMSICGRGRYKRMAQLCCFTARIFVSDHNFQGAMAHNATGGGMTAVPRLQLSSSYIYTVETSFKRHHRVHRSLVVVSFFYIPSDGFSASSLAYFGMGVGRRGGPLSQLD